MLKTSGFVLAALRALAFDAAVPHLFAAALERAGRGANGAQATRVRPLLQARGAVALRATLRGGWFPTLDALF